MSKINKRDSKPYDCFNSSFGQTKQFYQWKQIKTSSGIIQRRYCHSSCIEKDKLYIYGGFENNSQTVLKDLAAFSIKNRIWQIVQQKGQMPGPRHLHTTIIYNNKIYLFGGLDQHLNSNNKLYIFDIDKNQWKLSNTINNPPPIDSHKSVLYNNQMIVAFGYAANDYSSNIYSLNLQNLNWKQLTKSQYKKCPQPRSSASVNLYKNSLFIYGGKNFSNTFSDIWQFNLITNQFIQLQVTFDLPKKYNHSGIVYKQNLYIFGGTQGVTNQKNDLLCFNIETKYLKVLWQDSQQQKSNILKSDLSLKKNKRQSCFDMIKYSCQQQTQSQNLSQFESNRKYRRPLKQDNYYNNLYQSRKINENILKRQKQNRLLQSLQTSGFNHHDKEHINLTSTFQVMMNSIPVISTKSNFDKQQTHNKKQADKKLPKPRDNYSVQLYDQQNPQMIIFGGSFHKIAFNDVLIINIKQDKNNK